MQVFVHLPQAGTGIVRAANGCSTGFAGKLAQSTFRSFAYQVFIAFQVSRHWVTESPSGFVSVHRLLQAYLCDPINGRGGFSVDTLSSQAGSINRIDTDVGAVGVADNRAETGRRCGRDGDPFGEKNQSFSSRQRAHSI